MVKIGKEILFFGEVGYPRDQFRGAAVMSYVQDVRLGYRWHFFMDIKHTTDYNAVQRYTCTSFH